MGLTVSAKPIGRARHVAGRTRTSERRRQILSSAFEEFAAKGYEAARLDDVARRAQIAKGTIYLHFKNKEVLFRAVVRDRIQSLLEKFCARRKGVPVSAEELLRELLTRQFAAMAKNENARGILRLLVAESGKFPRLASVYRREIIEPGTAAIRSVIEKGSAAGEFEKRKVAEFPQILAAPAVLAAVWMLVLSDPKPFDLDGYLDAYLELLIAGLRKTRAREDGETRK